MGEERGGGRVTPCDFPSKTSWRQMLQDDLGTTGHPKSACNQRQGEWCPFFIIPLPLHYFRQQLGVHTMAESAVAQYFTGQDQTSQLKNRLRFSISTHRRHVLFTSLVFIEASLRTSQVGGVETDTESYSRMSKS